MYGYQLTINERTTNCTTTPRGCSEEAASRQRRPAAAILSGVDAIFRKCQGLSNVCFISTQNGRICIEMKFCGGSIGDKMAQLKGSMYHGPPLLLSVLGLGPLTNNRASKMR